MCFPHCTAGCLLHKKPPHKLLLICRSDGYKTWQVGGLEGGTEGVVGRSVVDVNLSVGCWEVMFRTRGFAGSTAHGPDDLEEG